MKKQTIFTLLLATFIGLTVTSLQAQVLAHGPMLSEAELKTEVTKRPSSNEKEVLSGITQHISNAINDFTDLLAFYNSDVEFTLSFHVNENGKIEQITSSDSCKSPIAAALVRELKELGKVSPVLRDGVAIQRQFRIPVRFEKG